ncbi:reverse transcriptase [Cucumis melo var. makuwa]|uniref:Reverse transcriptase n=1 Tax=Cucumis melo var. makuwa TaxID=1194695 RepID=A0A5D3DKD9_CUCMM|nr:reverse transcriptase [Cucumis melo var. makuwa]
MSSTNQSGKAQRDRLVELEEQMLYLVKVPDSICFLEFRLEEIAEKSNTIDAVADRVEGLPIHEVIDVNTRLNLTMRAMVNQASVKGAILVSRVKILKPKPFCGARDAKALENYICDLEQYFKATNTVTEEVKVTLAMMHLSEDAKLWWRSRYVDMQERRCTIDTWDALKKELRSQFFPENASLTSDLDDKSNQVEGEVDHIEEGEKPRIEALKYLSSLQKKVGERSVPVERGLLYVDTWINQKQTKCTMVDSGATHNFIIEAEARRLGLRWEKDSRRMKAMNFIDLPFYWEFLLEHQVISMPLAKCLVITGSFPTIVQADIHQPNGFKKISVMQLNKSLIQEEPPSVVILLGALGKLGETVPKDTLCVPEKCHGVMPNSWPKSLSMRRVDHGIELLPEAKMPAKNAYPPVLSLKKKDRNLQRCINRRILNKLTASRKYPLPILTNLFNRSRGVKYFPKSDIRPRYYRVKKTEQRDLRRLVSQDMERQINVLSHVVELYRIDVGKRKIVATCDWEISKSVVELRSCPRLTNNNREFVEGFLKRASSLIELLKENIQWGGNPEWQTAFDGLKRATIEGPSLGVTDGTKPSKDEAERFNCMLGEYLHHLVDGRQRNWVQLLNVAQFGHSAQTDSPIRRIQFEIDSSRHFVLPPVMMALM